MRLQAIIFLVLALIVLCFGNITSFFPPHTSTFSLVAYDPETREWGIAVASRVLAVGYIVPWAEAGVGAIATQAYANIDYGVEGLKLLREGKSAEAVLAELKARDKEAESRQVAIMDRDGNVAAFTGKETLAWSGNITHENLSAQGNILAGERVLTDMVKAYENSKGPLARRMIEALKAADAAGGDKRGKQSSAILVVKDKGGYQGKFDRLVDIKVDDNAEPIKELERIYNLWEYNFLVAAYLDSPGEKEKELVVEIMDRIISEKSKDPEVYNNFAWELATRKVNPKKAIEIGLMAHQLAPTDANIMDTLAEAYYSDNQFEKAVEWEKKALELEKMNEGFKRQLEKFKNAKRK